MAKLRVTAGNESSVPNGESEFNELGPVDSERKSVAQFRFNKKYVLNSYFFLKPPSERHSVEGAKITVLWY